MTTVPVLFLQIILVLFLLFLLFHPRCILLVLHSSRLRSRTLHGRHPLLSLFMYCRGSLLRSRLWGRSWLADVFTTLSLLGAWGRRCDLLVRR